MKKHKFSPNVVLSVLFILTTASIFLGGQPNPTVEEAVSAANMRQMWNAVHYGAGTLFSIGCAAHTGKQWKWVKNILVRRPKKLAKRLKVNLAVDVWLFALFLPCGVAGIVIWLMKGILPDPFLLSREAWSSLHLWTGRAMVFGIVVHLVCHWKWIVSTLRRKPKADIGQRQQRAGQTVT